MALWFLIISGWAVIGMDLRLLPLIITSWFLTHGIKPMG